MFCEDGCKAWLLRGDITSSGDNLLPTSNFKVNYLFFTAIFLAAATFSAYSFKETWAFKLL